MWPFNSRNSEEDDLPPPGEIIQSSFNPAELPDLIDETDLKPPPLLNTSIYRLGVHPLSRLEAVAGLSGTIGFLSGFIEGSDVAILCYRAENAHLTPNSTPGWYLYSKSKYYHGIVGGCKQGTKTALRYFGWTALFLTLESGLDAARGKLLATKSEKELGQMRRGQSDFLNTVSAAVAVVGIHSWWNGLDRFAASRSTRQAIKLALPYGMAQDLVFWMRGENPWYVDKGLRLLGKGIPDSQSDVR